MKIRFPRKNNFFFSDHVFVVAEVGSNWRAGSPRHDWKRALTLIDAACDAGADAVKFQTFRAESVYVSNAGASDYLSRRGERRSIIDIFKDMSMPYPMIGRLAAACRKRGIEFMSSFFSAADFKAVDPHVRIHKIASYEISHPQLLTLAACSKKPLILSTGASNLEEIAWAVRFYRSKGGRALCLMQCTAKYPAPLRALNLKVIPALAKRFGVIVGFSDHSRDPWTAPVAAVALGARVIEKHFTLSNRLAGPDHAFAVTPRELKQMVAALRRCEEALGDGRKRPLPEERELRAYAQRALQATCDIKSGDRLNLGRNMAILRPGKQPKGTHPMHLGRIEGHRALHAVAAGRGIHEEDVAS